MMQILFIFCDPSLRRILQPLSNNILENRLVSDDHTGKPPRWRGWISLDVTYLSRQIQRKPICHYNNERR